MQKRRLGRTPIEISPIGLGCWQFSEGKGLAGRFWGSLGSDAVHEIVAASLAGGINWFDTAEIYGKGRSELALAKALLAAGKGPGDVVVATKWWPLLRTASSIGSTIGERLKCLDPFPIDLHQIHQPIAIATVAAQMNAMADLIDKGKIRSAGVSNFSAAKLREAHAVLATRGFALASNQVKYSLLDRRIETNGVLDTARALNVTIVAFSPLEQGLLSGKFHDDPSLIRTRSGPRRYLPAFRDTGLERSRALVTALKRIADAHGATPSQVALSWLVRFHGDTVVAIPGATKVRHAQENVHALDLVLKDNELAIIDDLSRQFRERNVMGV